MVTDRAICWICLVSILVVGAMTIGAWVIGPASPPAPPQNVPEMPVEATQTPQNPRTPPTEGSSVTTPVLEEIRAEMASQEQVPPCEPIAYADIPVVAAEVDHQYQTARDAWMNEIIAPKLAWINRVTVYVRAMGIPVTDEEIAYFTQLALEGGYDPRLWCVMAMAESSGRNNGNIYGYCGGAGSPWANPGGDWRQQTEWLDNRIRTFYAQSVDISKPEQVLWFHHEGEGLNGRDPYSVEYVWRVRSWMEGF